MAEFRGGTSPGQLKSVMNALEILHNCVYLIEVRKDYESKLLAQYMTSALDVVTAFVTKRD
jgi:hypothetical protein